MVDKRKNKIGLLCAIVLTCLSGVAFSQSLKLSVESREIYADLPFVLNVSAEGFEESPEPAPPELNIDGATVRYLGMSPSVRSSLSIINGRRTENKSVTFVYQYKVSVSTSGSYTIPEIEIEQGALSAVTKASQFKAKSMTATSDMKISVALPQRDLWIGESVPITIDWYLRRDPRDQNFVIPLFDESIVEVSAPEANGRRALEFSAGAKNLKLPYDSDKVMDGGVQYTRFRFHAVIRPKEIGNHKLSAPKVIAELSQGRGRDSWGFSTTKYGRFKAEGQPFSMQVKGVPLSGKPQGFSGAVGKSFSWDIEASKTLVSVGEPIELTISIRGENGLDGLALPDLVAAGLPKESFTLPTETAAGAMSEDGLTKVFKVIARVSSNAVRDIPPLSLSYFDPSTGSYGESKSQAIALSVEGADVVGAGDVIGAPRSKDSPSRLGADDTDSASSNVVGADLSLSESKSDDGASNNTKWTLAGIYGAAIAFFLIALLRSRTESSRVRQSKRKSTTKKFNKAISEAREKSAKESSSFLLSSYKSFVSERGLEQDKDWIAQVENAAYDPKASGEPLSKELLSRALELLQEKKQKKSKAINTIAAIVLLSQCIGIGELVAEGQGSPRDAYQKAMAEKNVDLRRGLFEKAAKGFSLELNERPSDSELMCDLGQAALGASDFGQAVLAYKRALILNPEQKRARQNLGWVRQRMPSWSVPNEANVNESFVFWHYRWSKNKRHWVAALAFALMMLLVSPLGSKMNLRRKIAFLPGALFLAMVLSLLLGKNNSTAAVVVNSDEILRSADNRGAPPILSTPLLSGMEVDLREVRGDWAKVKMANNTEGWLQSDAVTLVIAPSQDR